tara:strand:- start:285 stop:569 length:285 start_codon:yes stop_codon:yes gene_type:complete
LDIKVHVSNVDGTQMAAKINGTFDIDSNSFEFMAIAFGRIGGQNIGVKLSEETENKLKTLEYNVDQVIDELQKKLISGNLSVPDGLKRESFIDD